MSDAILTADGQNVISSIERGGPSGSSPSSRRRYVRLTGMSTTRTAIPGCPGWYIGTVTRGHSPDEGGTYTEMHLQVEDPDAPQYGVGPRRALVVRLPGRPDEAEILAGAHDQVIAWLRDLPAHEQEEWLWHWVLDRVECLVCRRKASGCTCSDGPHVFPADGAKALGQIRRELLLG